MPDSKSKPNPHDHSAEAALLISGGLDSAVLLGELLARGATVRPLYVRCGLRWEPAELEHVVRYLAELHRPQLRALHVLNVPVDDLYANHWSIVGPGVPDHATHDDAVFLPGRNVLLLSKALLWCHLHGVPTLSIATLKNNPFADATPTFMAALETAVNQAVTGRVRIDRPFAELSKREVLQRGRDLPLQWTLSCLTPEAGHHCGHCNKCAERRRAFADAGLADPTVYQR